MLMGSNTIPVLHLPVVDLSAVSAGDGSADAWSRAGAQFDAAMRVHGVVHLTGTGVPPSLVSTLRSRALSFFAQPSAAKHAFSFAEKYGAEGYCGIGAETVARSHSSTASAARDAVESLVLHTGESPACPPAMRASASDYLRHMARVLGLVLRLTDKGLGAPSFSEVYAKPKLSFRIAHYPSAAAAAGEGGYGAHTDFSGYTLLCQDASPRFPAAGALEVLVDGEWRPVQPLENAILVNAGDLIERGTNGRYRSPIHRVRLAATRVEPRLSLVCFTAPADAAVVSPLAECCGEENPPKYTPVVAGEWLKEKLRRTAAGEKEQKVDE